ncbi:MAG TPA: PilN domain-containing protein [Bryobacteraceae bacterium]|nr:PilN domain-containing protein [Bryobacteraceae bacterium]
MIPNGWKKVLAFGSGVGIEISGPRGSESLHIAAVRVRPTGARLIERLVIEDFPHQPAGAWGTDLAAFLRRLDLHHVPATVVLPRADVIVRQLALPGVAPKDLGPAIQFQLDSLHPYPEDDVMSSWTRLAGTPVCLVAIARRAAIERYARLFAEAGIKIGCFTCSAASIYSALRLFGQAPAKEILAWENIDGRTEFYGESPAHPLFSASFDPTESRAAALACAELRIDPSTEPTPLEKLVSGAPALPYSAALASACPRHSVPLNLLPAERRDSSSRAAWISATALALFVFLLTGLLIAMPAYDDHRYQRSLQAEIAKVEPQARRAAQLDQQIEAARQRSVALDDFRRRSKSDMDAIEEMTHILPVQVWLNLLDLSRAQVYIAGEADQAAPLLKLIDASPLFERSEFAIPPMRAAGGGENFRIRTNRRAGR